MTRLLPAALLLLTLPALAQDAPTPTPTPAVTATAEVVVSAEALPQRVDEIGTAATVLTGAELAARQQTSLLEALREVPGLDVVQSGGSGAVTSLFLRGASSTSTLFMVDGVKLNSSYFGLVDLSALTSVNLDRVEVVRGPYSALYGSDAIGGLVRIFTRRSPAAGFSARGTLAGGNDGAREATLSAALGAGPWRFTAGFRRLLVEGELPNDFFAVTNLSGALEVDLGSAVRTGLLVNHLAGRTGIPISGGELTPNRSTTQDTLALTLPVAVTLSGGFTVEAAATFLRERPTFTDPDDPFGFTSTVTDARRAGGRAVVSREWAAHRLSVGADLEHTDTSNEDSYGVELDGRTTRTWAVFAEERVELLSARLAVTLGLRHDDHSAYGGSTNPRLSVSYRLAPSVRLRAAAGTAFRSPTTGELYYPFSGNPGLGPEEATSYEVGAVWQPASPLSLEATLFRSSIRNLIQYDFTTGQNRNVGRARTAGLELAARARLESGLYGRVSYTYLDAVDRASGEPLLRRPRHRASLSLGVSLPRGAFAEATALFVGRRADVDAITFTPVEDPSYARLDLAATGPRLLGRVAPFARLTNVLGRDYAEAAGFPAPGRRILAGLDVGF